MYLTTNINHFRLPLLYDFTRTVCLIFALTSHIKSKKRSFRVFKNKVLDVDRLIKQCVNKGSNTDLITVILPIGVNFLLFQ